MNRCTRCVMPDTRPGVQIINGLCNGCRHAEYKKTVDWEQRRKEFEKLCNKYKRQQNEFDCAIAVSSGKDSWYQIHMLKKYGMNPLLVSVDNLDWTETGKANFEKMLDVFGCECIVHKSSHSLNRKMSRIGFEHDGFIAWLFDRLIYTYPLHMATKFDIPLVIYGENVSLEYGGFQTKETLSAKEQINNDVVRDYGWDLWTSHGIKMSQLNLCQLPDVSKLDPCYLSYYFDWSGYKHYKLAQTLGWKSLADTGEWKREGYIEDYDQLDDFAYLVDPWLKYPKYGHARATDVACYWIRDGIITRDEAVKLVKEHDHKLDPIALEHYLKFSGYTESEFWQIVEKFYNRDLFEKKGEKWQLKNPLYK